MNNWETIRLRCVRDKEPIKQVARELGCSPNTIRKYIRSQRPPQKSRLKRDGKLDKYCAIIDEMLRNTPRITAKRIGDILKRDYDEALEICERSIRKHIAKRRKLIVPKEVFLRAEYLPGRNAQFDFSPMRVFISTKERLLQIFVMRLSYSGHMFVRASEREDLPALMAGINGALTFFGGVPHVAIFDNAKTAVAGIGRGSERTETLAFQAFRGQLAMDVQYAAPARGNEKGGVEGAHGFIEDNFFRPIPKVASLIELNQQLERFCSKQLSRIHSTRERLTPEVLQREINAQTKVVSVSWVSFIDGYRHDLAALADIAHKNGALFVVDGIQGLGTAPFDMRAMNIDAVFGGGQKWLLAEPGLGFLCVTPALLERMHVYAPGWRSVEDIWNFLDYKQSWAPDATRFEAGTPNLIGITALVETLDLLEEAGLENIQRHISVLTNHLQAGLERNGAIISGPARTPATSSGIVTFTMPNRDPLQIGHEFAVANICTTNRTNGIRVSPHGYNTIAEIDALLEQIAKSV